MKTITEQPLLQTHPLLSLSPSNSASFHAVLSSNDNIGGEVSFLHSNAHHVISTQRRDVNDNPRHLFSTCSADNTIVFVTSSEEGGVCISLRGRGGDDDSSTNCNVEISLSSLPSLSTISATCCFLIEEGVLLRLVDGYGSILSILLATSSGDDVIMASENTPSIMGSGGLLIPVNGHLQILNAPQVPHPGSTVEHCQVCFPSSESVLMGFDPHLYFVDFSDDLFGSYPIDVNMNDAEGEYRGNITVWSSHHKMKDPIHPTTLRDFVKEVGITMGLTHREIKDGEHILPSVSAVACLHNQSDRDGRRVVVTLHSDGSLRLWTKNYGSIVPLVRRIVISDENEGYVNPPLSPSTWDSYDSIVLNGSIGSNNEYELGLYVKCLNGPMVHVFDGSVGGTCDEMKTLELPTEWGGDVKDLMWNEEEGLVVLMKRLEEGENNNLVVFPRGEVKGWIPDNWGSGGVNGSGAKIVRLSVEEELEKYFVSAQAMDDDQVMEDGGDEASENSGSESVDEKIARVEAAVDKAGLLSLLQPMGRQRPQAIAIHRALTGLSLADNQTKAESIGPVDIVGAMRKWKRRDMFRPSSSEEKALVLRQESHEMVVKSPEAAAESNSIYHMFASAKKDSSSRPSPPDSENRSAVANLASRFSGVSTVDSAENKHLMRWITFLTEVRRQEAILNEVLCLATVPYSNDLLVRSSMISTVTFDEASKEKGPLGYEGEGLKARLDELSLDMLLFASSNAELRSTLCHVESLLFKSASKASCLISRQRIDDRETNELCSEMTKLGVSILDGMNIDNRQMELHRILSELDIDSIEKWLQPPSSKSQSVRASLALTSNANEVSVMNNDAKDAQSSAVAIATAKLESIRQLTLARSLLLLSLAESLSTPSYVCGLRASLFCTALLWSLNQPSYQDCSNTVLEHFFSQELKASPSSNASGLAENFVSVMFHFYSGAAGTNVLSSSLLSSTREPRITLRLVAPLVEYPIQTSATSSITLAAAKCLLVESSFLCQSSSICPENLWELASELLSNIAPMDLIDESNMNDTFEALLARVSTLQDHLQLIEKDRALLSECCNVALSAIHDAISFIISHFNTSNEVPELANLWSLAFETSMKGNLWDQALRSCVSSPLRNNRDGNFKRLVLDMVDSNAIGKLVDMSMTVVRPQVESEDVMADTQVDICFDIFDAATKIIEEAACEECDFSHSTADDVGATVNGMSNYWGVLYTLHASRGNWKRAAQAMDMCGKAAASFATTVPSIDKATSKQIMESASLSASACYHTISLIEKVADRYLIPKEGNGVLTKEDIESRAIRAMALRAFSMDEFAPDSVSTILKATSRDTIDLLARLGYYDHAISVAKGFADKRGCCPRGINLFDDSVRHILTTYLVPAATRMAHRVVAGADEDIQSRSKVAQIRLSSTACNVANPLSQSSVSASSTNSHCFRSNTHCDQALRSDLAMNLLRQYTTVYSRSCNGLGLHVAGSILLISEGTYALPNWLKELCTFGVDSVEDKKCGLFASPKRNDQVADPAGLVRLYMEYHRYKEACDVVTSVLSRRNGQLSSTSSRLPEKGSIDFLPYNLIDSLHAVISNITGSVTSDDPAVQSKLVALRLAQSGMEKALIKHFELLKLSEEGLMSARALAVKV
ncbi:hypothetical protein ACHAXN_011101 [Cyclotella atomus]